MAHCTSRMKMTVSLGCKFLPETVAVVVVESSGVLQAAQLHVIVLTPHTNVFTRLRHSVMLYT